jgi:sulfatase modifying factor 1
MRSQVGWTATLGAVALLAGSGCVAGFVPAPTDDGGEDSGTSTSADGGASTDAEGGPSSGRLDGTADASADSTVATPDAAAPLDGAADASADSTVATPDAAAPEDAPFDSPFEAMGDANSTAGDASDGSPACTNACAGGALQCAAGGVEACVTQSNGCTAWATATQCPSATPFCNGAGICGDCQNGTSQCSFNGVQTCANGAWGSAVSCPIATPNCNAASCGEPASCQASAAGTTNCGAASESCCSSLDVPSGSFDRTYTNSGGGASGEADPASVSSFRLDKYQVTVGRFRQYVNYVTSGAGAPPANGSGKHTHLNGGMGLANSGSPGTFETGWIATDWNADIAVGAGAVATWNTNLASCSPFSTWTSSAAAQENLPLNCMTWFEAYAFCIWDGGFLPSEAEWEYVAAGGNQQREFPWGATNPGTTNQYAIYGCNYSTGSGTCTDVTNIAPVGTASLGAGLWGQLDLAGEMLEWNLDWSAPFVDPCTDCSNMTPASYQVVHGGSYDLSGAFLFPPSRLQNTPVNRSSDVGIRCARTP